MEPQKRPVTKRDAILFVVALVVFAVYIWWSDALWIIRDPPTISFFYLSIGILFNILLQVNMAYRFGFILKGENREFSMMDNFLRHLVLPLFARITPGQIGTAYKLTISNIDTIRNYYMYCYIYQSMLGSYINFTHMLWLFCFFLTSINFYFR